MAQLAIKLLGTFEVTNEDGLLSGFETDQVRALLAYLAHEHDRPHRRETLAGLFWPESDQRRARQSLSQALYNLRRTLGTHASLLSSTGQEICLHVNGLVWLDTLEFHQCCQASQTHQHERIEFCTACQAVLERTVGLYRAEMLAGLYLAGCEEFERWLDGLRSYYHNQVVRVWEWLAAGAELRRSDAAGIDACRNLLSLDPYNEEALRRLMRLLARSTGRNEALRAYTDFHKFLHQEMGLPPEVETTRLYESLKNSEDRSSPPSNLPVPLDILIGREEEMNKLFFRLVDPQHRLVSLVGPGGAGKTRLALEAAQAMLPAFPDGVFWIEISGISGPEALLPEIARAVNFLPERDPANPQRVFTQPKNFMEQFFTYLCDKDILLVLDSFETLLPAAPSLVNLLAHAPQVHLLVTSRARLNLIDEYVIPLEGLSLQPVHDRFSSSPAVRLFEHTARKSKQDYHVEEVSFPVIARICQAVEGMPLGILLAASWVSLIDPQEIERQIQSDLDFLSDGWHDLPQHQRSLRATYEYSWSILNPHQHQALSRLAVFRQSFTAHNAQQICQVSLPMLKTLHNHSLLQVRSDGRYRLHDLLHSFCREKLQQDAIDWNAMHERLSQLYLDALHSWGEGMKTDRMDDVIPEMDLEIENTRQGWDWALQARNWTGLHRGLYGLNRYLRLRSRWSEATQILQQAIQKIEAEGISQANFHLWFEVSWRLIMEEQDVSSEAQYAVLEKLALELDAPAWADLDLLRERAIINRMMGDLWNSMDTQKAEPHLFKSLELFHQAGDSFEISQTLFSLGHYYRNMGKTDQMFQVIDEALMLIGQNGDPFLLDNIYVYLSFFYLISGQVEQGLPLIERMRQLVSSHPILKLGNPVQESLGIHLFWAGEYQAAHDIIKEYIEYSERQNKHVYDIFIVALVLTGLFLGHYDQAWEDVTRYCPETEYFQQFWLLCQAKLHLHAQDFQQALTYSKTAYNQALNPHEYLLLGVLAGMIGYIYYRFNNWEQARTYFLDGLRVNRESSTIFGRNLVLGALALLLAEAGCLEASLAVWAAIADHPTLKNSIWHADVFYKPLAGHTDSLTEVARQAACALGKRMPVQEIEAHLEESLQSSSDLQAGLRSFAAWLV